MHIHILGICGTFMGGIAALAKSNGHKVTGCDQNVYPPMSTQLEQLGIEITEGYNENQIKLNPDIFIIGNVISRENPLIESILIKAGTCVFPSSGQVTITSISSPTDFPRIFKNKYSISNVDNLSTFIPLVSIQ